MEKPKIETLVVAKRTIGAKPKDKGKSLPKSQRGPQVKHFVIIVACEGIQGQIASSFKHSRGLILFVAKTTQEEFQREFKLKEKMRDNSLKMLKNISSCLASFTPRFESYVGRTPSFRDLTQNTRTIWVKKGTHA